MKPMRENYPVQPPRTHEQPTIWEIPVKTRCDEPFIEPQFKYEIDGRRVFTFTEGAVHF
jgi:hypothetical protein